VRLCRFNEQRIGIVRGHEIRDVTSVLEALPAHRYPFPAGDALIAALPQLAPRLIAASESAPALSLEHARLLAPLANPGKIIGAPVNYRRHLEEVRADPGLHHQSQINEIHRAGLFLKATSSLIGASQPICIRHPERRTDHEVELAAVIGSPCDRISRDVALQHVAGYCIGLDITVRGPEERSLRKSIDSYTVLGPWLVTADELADAGDLALSIAVNGVARQSARTSEMILGVPELIELASSFYTLYPGDVLLTGTPAGVGPIEPGDVLQARIEAIGEMSVGVITSRA